MRDRGETKVQPNGWIDKRRDFFVRKILDDFFSIHRDFQDVYAVYLECLGSSSYSRSDLLLSDGQNNIVKIWDHLNLMVGSENDKGPLWQLKDLCHLVWPEDYYGQDRGGSIVDWLIGSIFHETMKLKEDIYLLVRYGSAASKMKEHEDPGMFVVSNALVTPPTLENIMDIHGVIVKAANDVVKQLEQLASLFNRTCYMLRIILPSLADNLHLVRLLVERQELLQRIWGESLGDIFNDMFWGDGVEGFCRAGRSYLSGHWFYKALQVYKMALRMNPACDEAITRMAQLQQIISENKELLLGRATQVS